MQHTAPKQCKLLGATVRDVGVIVAVSSTLHFGYAIVEAADRVNHRVAFTDLKHSEVEFPALPQPFTTRVERVSYGTWDEVHSLVPAHAVVLSGGGLMAASQHFVGATTPFGKVVAVSDRLFNPTATVQAKDGSRDTYRLPFLIALGVTFAGKVTA